MYLFTKSRQSLRKLITKYQVIGLNVGVGETLFQRVCADVISENLWQGNNPPLLQGPGDGVHAGGDGGGEGDVSLQEHPKVSVKWLETDVFLGKAQSPEEGQVLPESGMSVHAMKKPNRTE